MRKTLRRLLWLAPVAGAAGLGLAADRYLAAAAQGDPADPQPAAALPVSRVVLFTSGVGYFSREGQVDGDARVDLRFLERDINDLLKSLTLEDRDGGRVAAVAYDSREPVARTLASFAVDLSGHPSVAQILTQARGERVEVALQPTPQAQPGTLSGVVVGVEKQKLPSGPTQTLEADCLTLLTADGLRTVKLPDVLRVKFQNPALEAELRRALEVVALSHDARTKAVSVQFAGDGRRRVRVGYVAEAPVWKATYRLALPAEAGAGAEAADVAAGQPKLQGWAAVENTSDDDWQNVRMALVAGRPISFKMDLYNPLFVPRPVVEPELFASLRPPAYDGGFGDDKPAQALQTRNGAEASGIGGGPGRGSLPRPALAAAPNGVEFARKAADGLAKDQVAEKAKGVADERRLYAERLGRELADTMYFASVQSAATASKLGDSFRYVVDHPVTLPRQKSALLPVVAKDVSAARVSIYNPAVQPKHPLLGVRFKNTTGANLAQGPVTVYDGGVYAGDARVQDVQPNEERLLAFAVDLGMEVDPQTGPGTTRVTAVKANKGIVTTTTKVVEEKKYKVVNRSDRDRALVVEHPNRAGQQFKLVDTPKPVEETAELVRFQLPVAAGKTETLTVKEEREASTSVQLTNSADDTIRYVLSLNEASPALKAKLQEAQAMKAKWDGHRRELGQVQADLQRLNQDQDRIRRNLRETPPQAEVYKTYLAKLSAQEKEIDALTDRQKELMGREFQAKKQYDDFLATIGD